MTKLPDPYTINTAGEFLEEALRCVTRDRNITHGNAADQMAHAARLVNAAFNTHFTPSDISLIMALCKISRTRHGTFNQDDWVDLLGYGGIAGALATEEHESRKGLYTDDHAKAKAGDQFPPLSSPSTGD
jgi:Domain of unknown function (DUF6378)